MSSYAAKRRRTAIEDTAALVGDGQGPAIPVRNRYDQNPTEFAPDRGADDDKALPFGLNWLKR